jgi:hypothetical protein
MEAETSRKSFCVGFHAVAVVAFVYRVPSIKQVSDDRATEAEMMGAVDAKLVCTSCIRI